MRLTQTDPRNIDLARAYDAIPQELRDAVIDSLRTSASMMVEDETNDTKTRTVMAGVVNGDEFPMEVVIRATLNQMCLYRNEPCPDLSDRRISTTLRSEVTL